MKYYLRYLFSDSILPVLDINIVRRIIKMAANILAITWIVTTPKHTCYSQVYNDSSAITLSTEVRFGISATETLPAILHHLQRAALSQKNLHVTAEIYYPLAENDTKMAPVQILPVLSWLGIIRQKYPELQWHSSSGIIRLFYFPKSYASDPLDETFSTSYQSNLPVDNWLNWLVEQFPQSHFHCHGNGYSDLDYSLNFDMSQQNKKSLKISIERSETVRSFLDALASGSGGTWAADLRTLNSVKPVHTPHVFPDIPMNDIYIIKP